MTKIKAVRARNSKYVGKSFELTEVEKGSVYEITIGKTVYIGRVDKTCGINIGFDSIEDQAGNEGICFCKKSNPNGRVWFDEFDIIAV